MTDHSINELDVLWALGITVSSSVLGTSLIPGPSRQSSICIHLCEVESAIKTAGKVGHIHVECEFLVEKLQDLV